MNTQTMYSVLNADGVTYKGVVENPAPKGDPNAEMRWFDSVIDGKPVDLVSPKQLAEDLADFYDEFKDKDDEDYSRANTAELSRTVLNKSSKIYIINHVNELMNETDNKDLITRGKILIYQLINIAA